MAESAVQISQTDSYSFLKKVRILFLHLLELGPLADLGPPSTARWPSRPFYIVYIVYIKLLLERSHNPTVNY